MPAIALTKAMVCNQLMAPHAMEPSCFFKWYVSTPCIDSRWWSVKKSKTFACAWVMLTPMLSLSLLSNVLMMVLVLSLNLYVGVFGTCQSPIISSWWKGLEYLLFIAFTKNVTVEPAVPTNSSPLVLPCNSDVKALCNAALQHACPLELHSNSKIPTYSNRLLHSSSPSHGCCTATKALPEPQASCAALQQWC